MIQLTYNDEFFEYHGFISLGSREVVLHFPLYNRTTERDLLAKHENLLARVASRFEWLVEQAVKLNQPHDDLPEVDAVIVDEDGTFEFQFGSCARQDKLWCEVYYQNDGVAYHYERHPPVGGAG